MNDSTFCLLSIIELRNQAVRRAVSLTAEAAELGSHIESIDRLISIHCGWHSVDTMKELIAAGRSIASLIGSEVAE